MEDYYAKQSIEAAKVFMKPIIDSTVGALKKEYKKSLVDLGLAFSKYYQRSYERYSKMKTLLYRDKPVDLKKHYVATDFALGDEFISGASILTNLINSEKSVIMGTAGAGKSILLRRLFIDLVENPKGGLTPFLIELRYLITPEKSYTIFELMLKILNESDDNITSEQLHYALKQGKLIIFLDGFDEIDFEQREKYELEVSELSNKYSQSIFVVSSRPDSVFESWEESYIYKALPLNKLQSVDLIQRIDYDNTVKHKFVKELQDGLFEKHKDFLANPLLLTMMLLTYEQLAEMPEKIHIFYEQAFDTLYHKHDALKSVYKRKTFTGLPIDDFKRVFSAFCLITYAKNKQLIFTKQEVRDVLGQAIKLENIDIDVDSFFQDLLKSVCVIQRDGNIYTFSHRSFQEYFTAFFISNSRSPDMPEILTQVCEKDFDIGRMLFEMNRELVERQWVIPKLAEYLNGIERPKSTMEIISFLLRILGEMRFTIIDERGRVIIETIRYSERTMIFRNLRAFYNKEDPHWLVYSRFGEFINEEGSQLLQIVKEQKWHFFNFSYYFLETDAERALHDSAIPFFHQLSNEIYDDLTQLQEELKAKYTLRKNSLDKLFLKG